MRYYAREGQIYCHECGEAFYRTSKFTSAGIASTACPNGHNRGSWVQLEPDRDFSIELEDQEVQ